MNSKKKVILFPKGIIYSYPGFSNSKLSRKFKLIEDIAASESTLVTLILSYPNRIIESLLELFNLFSPLVIEPDLAISQLDIKSWLDSN